MVYKRKKVKKIKMYKVLDLPRNIHFQGIICNIFTLKEA